MIRTRLQVLAFLILIFLVAGASIVFFSRKDSVQMNIEEDDGKIHVIASIYPLAYIASNIAGDAAVVTTLTPAGAEPHDFEPSPRDLVELERADLFLYNGGGLEPWITAWKRSKPTGSPVMIDMIAALNDLWEPLIVSRETFDPHVWLDPRLMEKEALFVRETLVRIDPLHKETYNRNTENLVLSLERLNKHFEADLRSCVRRDFITAHEAFAYLARAYHLNMIAIAGISPEEEPSPQNLAEIADLIQTKNIHFIFFETIASPRLAQTIAREVGGETLVLNPLESLSPSEVQLGEDYISVMTMNLFNLTKALECQ